MISKFLINSFFSSTASSISSIQKLPKISNNSEAKLKSPRSPRSPPTTPKNCTDADKKCDVKKDKKSQQISNLTFEQRVMRNSNEQFVQDFELQNLQPRRPNIIPPSLPTNHRIISRTQIQHAPPQNKKQVVKISNIPSTWNYDLVKRFLRKNKLQNNYEVFNGYVLVHTSTNEECERIIRKFHDSKQGDVRLCAIMDYI